MSCPGAAARRRSIAGTPLSSTNSVCSTMTTASAPRGTTPPVAMVVAEPAPTSRAGSCPQTITSPLSRKRRGAPSRAGGVGGTQRKSIDIGAVERRHIDRRDDVGGEDAAKRRRQRDCLARQRREIGRAHKTRARLLGRDDLQELLLPRSAANRGEEIM